MTRAVVMPESSPTTLALLLWTAAALHISAGTLVVRRLLPELEQLLAASSSPHGILMQEGLERFLVADAYLPPAAPTILAVALWSQLGRARAWPEVRQWFAIGILPHAVEALARAATVLVSGPAASTGELLSMPGRFSSGAILVIELLELSVAPGIRYWAGVLSVAALVSIYCWARALTLAQQPAERTSRRRARTPELTDELPNIVLVAGGYLAAALLVKLATPIAVRMLVAPPV